MYLFFDTETTGRNYSAPATDLENWPRLVQIAWAFFDEEEQEVESRDMLIKPDDFTIPGEAMEIHGITTERAMDEGIPLREALLDFSSFLEQTEILVAHNIDFDAKIVEAEFIRENIPNNLSTIPKICTMRQSTEFCRIPGRYGSYKWPSLSELHLKLFETPFEGAHDAKEDVRACANCLFELKRRGIVDLWKRYI
ncbi:MAG TPA: 3'-5' exonuclease [Candidatus Bathyarchaeia archaeon]|nr:3'-5' exonuclease [Candidatus Bathyarchaeia archaeon]